MALSTTYHEQLQQQHQQKQQGLLLDLEPFWAELGGGAACCDVPPIDGVAPSPTGETTVDEAVPDLSGGRPRLLPILAASFVMGIMLFLLCWAFIGVRAISSEAILLSPVWGGTGDPTIWTYVRGKCKQLTFDKQSSYWEIIDVQMQYSLLMT